MRVPIRKPGKFTHSKLDPHITQAKFDELKKNLQTLKTSVQPRLAKEVKRLALMGDFSENVEYQLAKGNLRGINQKILQIEKQIASAQIIKIKKNSSTIQIGNLVTIESNKQTLQYRILGSLETNPTNGTISYQSPLGSKLLNKKIDDTIEIKLDERIVKYKIIKIT